MKTQRVLRISLFTAAYITLASGCFEDGGPHTTASGSDGIVFQEGLRWCAEAEEAKVFYDDPTEGTPPVTLSDEENDDGPPRGCGCATYDLSDEINDIAVNDEAVIDGTHSQDLRDFRDVVFEATEDRCDELAAAVIPPQDSNNCSLLLVPGTTPIKLVAGDCIASVNGILTDGWADYHTLGSVISYNSGPAVYEIDMAFFEDILAHPQWLFADSAYIRFNGTSYQFYGVTSGDIAHALGIQTGYVPVTLNGMDVTNLPGMFAAMLALRYETEFQFIVFGLGGPVTLNYEIVP